jgi:hypothetical protein
MMHRRLQPAVATLLAMTGSVGLAGCSGSASPTSGTPTTVGHTNQGSGTTPDDVDPSGPHDTVTVAFAGDLHFQLHLAALLDHPRGALGPMTRTLADADVTMVNLESAITERGTLEAKELESPDDRYYYRTSPAALDLLALAGVDVVTMANNHAADYGPVGLSDTLRAIRRSPIPVVGLGKDRQAAFTPYRVTVGDTDLAFIAADASFREGSSSVWEAGTSNAGVAAAHAARPRDLLAAVRKASAVDDVVVVYLHWGREMQSCPTAQQRITARALADAGADVIVGSHAHVQLGSGWLGDTYVNYGLGNFLWYHDHQPQTGVLRLVISDGQVVRDSWNPARIQTFGRPLPLHGAARAEAISDWRDLRVCAGLAPDPSVSAPPESSPYQATSSRLGPALRRRMAPSHRPGCPVAWSDLRYLRLSYVGFDDLGHTGELVVHRRYARDVVRVFHRLYDARWPIRQLRLVDDFRADDGRSMAADNSSGYNCRRVAGSATWSAHALGAAIDLNPLENPDLSRSKIAPASGAPFATLDRHQCRLPPGAICSSDVVVRAFAAIGWQWGGEWSRYPDFQHFSAAEG